MKKHDRSVFFVSNGTGITAESIGHLLAHFPGVNFRQIRMPFIDSTEKLDKVIEKINRVYEEDGIRPVVILTFPRLEWREKIKASGALCMDVFSTFIDPLADELNQKPVDLSMSRGIEGQKSYHERMEAINFTLNHDDGMTEFGLGEAQVILVGVSRCGKTPTSLYLAMQFGIKAANYPIIPEDFERGTLPAILLQYPEKLFGLTIKPERLHSVRTERRPDSHYASLENCRKEVRAAEDMMLEAGVQWLDSTTRSIEEIATTILHRLKIRADESYL